MSDQKVPVKHYQKLAAMFPDLMSSLENLGAAIRDAGPIRGKTIELIQLAGAAAAQSEGSVHSHTRRALKEGASHEEIYHTLLLLISTIGFPKASAAINWAQDIMEKEK